MSRAAVTIAALAALAVAAPPAAAQPVGSGSGGVILKRIGSFDHPVYVDGAAGAPNLVFVVEQPGRVKIVRNGQRLRRSFLNITDLVNYDGGERGLFSIAFPPDYARSGRFYVDYTDQDGDLRVDEFRRKTATVAARGSQRKVLEVAHRANSNHNGGQLQFLGNLLYVSTGDGGSGDDPPDNAKNRNRLLGKILRINPRNPPGPRAYSIPRSNPFVGRAGRNEIFSYGLRNPWRFSFDRISANRPRIVIGDVGQNAFEEVDYETLRSARGANFGWDEWEAFAPHECDGACTRGTEKPIHAYGRGGGCAISGGFVVRDRSLRTLFRRYVYADFCAGDLRSLIPKLGGARGDRALGIHVDAVSSFGETPDGRLFVASLDGPVYRLAPAGASRPRPLPIGSGDGGVAAREIGIFESPVHVSGAPGYPRLVFVVEQPGRIIVLHRGRRLAEPFLDIRPLTICGSDPGACGEQGLLSVAFPPDYRRSGRFYVYLTNADGDNEVDEFRRVDAVHAAPASRRRVILFPHPIQSNHNGGQLQFHGRELLIATGDGGAAGDPPNNAQNRESLLGKLLRIVPRRTAAGRPYSVPGSNPFVGAFGRDEVFSYGLRNPYRFSVQPVGRGPDRVVIGDVGQDRFEEIDYETFPSAHGANFGWDAFEGFARYNCGLSCPFSGTADPGATAAPIHVYGHDQGCSVTGGQIVRDASIPTLRRRYVYADYCEGELRSLIPRLAGAQDDGPLGVHVDSVSSFGETPAGRVYVASLNGPVYRLVAR